MSTTNAFLLGAMAAWTPSLLVLAWLLRRSPQLPDRETLSSKAD